MKGSGSKKTIRFISVTADVLSIFSIVLTVIPFAISILSNAIIFIDIALGAVFAVLLVCIAFFRQRIAEKILKLFMNLTTLDKSYKIVRKTIVYEFVSREEMRHEKTFLVKALHNGVDSIMDKFQWSGGEVHSIEAIYKRDGIELLNKHSGIQTYRIYDKNGKRFGKGEEFEMGIRMELTDPMRRSLPYLSSGVYEITDRLKMVALFAMDLKPINIRKLSYIHYTDEDHYKCEDTAKLEISGEGDRKMIVFDIQSPIYGGKYVIDWDFDE